MVGGKQNLAAKTRNAKAASLAATDTFSTLCAHKWAAVLGDGDTVDLLAKVHWIHRALYAIAFVLCTQLLLIAQHAETNQDAPSTAAIAEAFRETSNGFSTDELMIRNALRSNFLSKLGISTGGEDERDAILRLLQLRKSGKLNVKATRRGPPADEKIFATAEIAARVLIDRHRVSLDTILADPRLLAELQAEAMKIDRDVDAYSICKAVLSLRKRRSLKPELVLKVANWDREITTHSLTEIERMLSDGELPDLPGVYLFRASEGYLYVGEAKSLAKRLTEHLSGSDRKSLAAVLASDPTSISVELHRFPKDSPARNVSVRRAYESELIRSRNPKLNVRP